MKVDLRLTDEQHDALALLAHNERKAPADVVIDFVTALLDAFYERECDDLERRAL